MDASLSQWHNFLCLAIKEAKHSSNALPPRDVDELANKIALRRLRSHRVSIKKRRRRDRQRASGIPKVLFLPNIFFAIISS